ncbi:ribose transport system substrate-binding protein [Thermomonospora echinospora]|uniref:Ribose transport system substrate-binding protein n=1 Tax=Thermomonospora echinospora TaxID=1992 RepID=A0A1H6CPK2_9ACTN|nr:substrate-binding domain-containing protein [Thermomonospora echinospora]SEG74555.1 ribose transport system substrate-binding protein [Thermomonospora echinospora]
MLRTFLIGVTAVAVTVVSACSVSTGPAGSSSADKPAGDQVVIGFSQVTQQSPFYVQLKNGAQQAADKAGAKLLFADANGDVTKQNNDIQDLITRGVDVLLINPVDPKGVAAGIAAAKAADIPVITVDRPVPSGAASHVGRDNVKMGELVGERVAQALGDAGGKVIEIQGDAGGAVARDRSKGFHQGVAGNSKIKIVQGPYCDYLRAKAVTAMQDLLQANPDVKAVYAHNDDMAMGALQVLRENRRTDVKVAGVDGLMEAVKAMPDGQYVATALNDPIGEGELAAQTAIKAARGEQVQASIDAGTALVGPADATKYVGDTVFAQSSS